MDKLKQMTDNAVKRALERIRRSSKPEDSQAMKRLNKNLKSLDKR